MQRWYSRKHYRSDHGYVDQPQCKSFLLASVAQVFARQGRLAGSFFSRATADHRNPQRLVPTIAYQLMVSVPLLKSFIFLGVLEDDSSICLKAPRYQLQNLIVEPVLKLLRPL